MYMYAHPCYMIHIARLPCGMGFHDGVGLISRGRRKSKRGNIYGRSNDMHDMSYYTAFLLLLLLCASCTFEVQRCISLLALNVKMLSSWFALLLLLVRCTNHTHGRPELGARLSLYRCCCTAAALFYIIDFVAGRLRSCF